MNVDSPFGFQPYIQGGGGRIQYSDRYRIDPTYGTKIYTGDVVHLANTGLIEIAAAGDTNLIGVFGGCRFITTLGDVQFSPFWPAPGAVLAGTEVIANVYDDPNMQFIAQTATGVAFAQTHVGNNVDFIATHAGSDVYGTGRQELDLASPGSGTANFRILALASDWLRNALGEHAKVICQFNEHLLKSATGI